MYNDNNRTLVLALFDTLVKMDNREQKPIPGIALSWSSKDDKVWTFKLRRNAKFSDGSPITSADVKYTLGRDLTPIDTQSMQALGVTTTFPKGFDVLADVLGATDVKNGKAPTIPASAITTPDKYTVRITLEAPRDDLPLRIAYPAFGIVKASNVGSSSAGNPWWYRPVSSGAFKVSGFVANTSVSLVPNSFYYGQKPTLKHVEFKVVTDTQTSEIAYEGNALDIVKTVYSDVPNLQSKFPGQLRPHYDRGVSVFLVNPTIPPTDDIHVVKALAMAIDKQTLSRTVLAALAQPARTFTPPAFPGYSKKGFNGGFTYDPAGARAEFAKSKYDPKDVVIRTFATGSQDPRSIQAIAQMWQNTLGIKVRILSAMPPASAPKSEGLQLYLAAQGPNFVAPCAMVQRWPDYITFADGANNVNNAAQRAPGLDAAMRSCYSASDSRVWSRVMAVENLMTEYPQFIPVLYNLSWYMVKPYVKNLVFGAAFNIMNLNQVWIAEH